MTTEPRPAGGAKHTIELDDGRIATYSVVGDEGEPLLFFPGGPGYAATIVQDDAALFADACTVYLIDPHGSGGSSPPQHVDDYSPEGTARFYETVRVALGLDTVNVGGHSFGSLTALAYAALFPAVTRRCIAVGTRVIGVEIDVEEGAGGADEEKEALARHRAAPWYPAARKTWDEWTDRVLAADDPAEVDAMLVEVMPLYLAHPDRPDVRARLEAFIASDWTTDLAAVKVWESGLYQRVDLRPLLPQITCPTLIVAGEHDQICGPVHAKPIVETLPDAELIVIPEVGHSPAMENPDAYRDAVLAWLRRTQPAVR